MVAAVKLVPEYMERILFSSASVLLFVTSLAKILSIGNGARILSAPDPVLSVSNLTVLMTVAVMELTIAVLLLRDIASWRKAVILLWLSCNFIMYRIAAWILNVQETCSCLGTVTHWMGVQPSTVDLVMQFLVAYLFTGSLLLCRRYYIQWEELRTLPSG